MEQATPQNQFTGPATAESIINHLSNLDLQHSAPPYLIYHFFYGTLAVPSLLQQIIYLPDKQKVRKANVIGYTIAEWGDYPAIIEGHPYQEIDGYAYIVQSEE
ncbi:hypothetical protein N7447_004825 [Penicillium robsamsonii]|uniref:uncharacterized protein n=1 Tax=Penicillium robsamsonii TaxID=1792511 RepID=UPI002548C70B|nr:uncharacterized protein N7447_004825 [Penicillium robsamsonii]KAJ5822485.1 hypothetical protein N7447_004825 [Penicillium robsamsonii]